MSKPTLEELWSLPTPTNPIINHEISKSKYNLVMSKKLVKDLAEDFKTLIGDESADLPDDFVISAINWSFRELPKVPKLDKVFTTHRHFNLDANDHYRWNINCGFRRLTDIGMLCFYSSTGGEPCKIDICYKEPASFFEKNGIVELKMAGMPCEYTIETESDDNYLVLDRPSEVPIIIDIICCGFPQPVKTMEDEIDISAPVEQLILSAMQTVYYKEAGDFAFSADIASYLDNKAIPEVIQLVNRRWGMKPNAIIGERN